MAARRGNGNGSDPVVTAIHELTAVVRELQVGQSAIEQVLRGHGRQLEALHSGLAGLKGELQAVKGELHEGFAELGAKIESAAARDRSLEAHVDRLDERLTRLEGRSP